MTFFIIKHNKNLLSTLLLFVFLSVCPALSMPVSAESMVIVNQGVGDTTLTKADIEKIFTGKKSKWSDGAKIIPVTLDNENDVHVEFLKKYVSKNAFQFAAYWRKMMFTGKGNPPKSFDSEQALIDYVAETSGAIGYVSTTAIKVKQVNVSE